MTRHFRRLHCRERNNRDYRYFTALVFQGRRPGSACSRRSRSNGRRRATILGSTTTAPRTPRPTSIPRPRRAYRRASPTYARRRPRRTRWTSSIATTSVDRASSSRRPSSSSHRPSRRSSPSTGWRYRGPISSITCTRRSRTQRTSTRCSDVSEC